MKKSVIRILSVVLILVMIIPCMSYVRIPVFAAESGTHGSNLSWKIDANGTLTISGSGEMYEPTFASDYPWYE